ncbi:MAG: flagellar biosynthetic protein FliO [Desulfatiglandaceae bacterium]
MNYSPDLIATAVKMIIVFGLLLGVLVAVLYFMKRATGNRTGQSKGSMIRVLASHYVGVKKNISLVEIPGTVLVVGITNDHIDLLTRIDDVEIMRQLSESGNEQRSFADHFQKISSLYKKKKG